MSGSADIARAIIYVSWFLNQAFEITLRLSSEDLSIYIYTHLSNVSRSVQRNSSPRQKQKFRLRFTIAGSWNRKRRDACVNHITLKTFTSRYPASRREAPKGSHSLAQVFRQFCKVADMFVKAPHVTYFWRRKAPFERKKRLLLGGSGGMLSQEIFEKEHSETLFPAFLES